jgi:FkbM family methyltransferase
MLSGAAPVHANTNGILGLKTQGRNVRIPQRYDLRNALAVRWPATKTQERNVRIPQRYNFVTQTRYGTLIYNKNDVRVGRSLELYGEYCERAIIVFDQILAAGQLVVDVGANIGTQTLFFAKKVGPEGCVLAFEPQRLVFQTLCGNMAINSITNVHCWNAAVGARQGEMLVPRIDHEQSLDWSTVECTAGGNGDRVPVIALDSTNLPRCSLLRIALPGMESAVLEGAASLISRLKPILYISCQLDAARETALLQRLAELGYASYWHSAELFNSQNYAGNAENVFGNQAQRSLLCLDAALERQLTGFTKATLPEAA